MERINTQFSDFAIEEIDRQIKKGRFTSRADLIRSATLMLLERLRVEEEHD